MSTFDRMRLMSLVRAFANIVKYHGFYRWKERLHFLPAVVLEKKYGISGISQQYVMPNGRDSLSMEADYSEDNKRRAYGAVVALLLIEDRKHFKSFLRKVWSRTLSHDYWRNKMKEDVRNLIQLNPVLKEIQCDLNDPHNMYNLILGVTSELNTDDIQYFLDCENGRQDRMEVLAATSKLRESKGIDIQWVPSPKTLAKITKFFEINLNKPLSSAHSMSPDQ